MKNIYIFHGWWSSPSDVWIPWLKEEVESKGYNVVVPKFSKRYLHDESMMGWLENIIRVPSLDDFFVTHSAGGQLAIRYCEHISKHLESKVGGMILVAPFQIPKRRAVRGGLIKEGLAEKNDYLLDNLSEELDEISRWGEMPIDWEKVLRVSQNNVCFYSGDDHFVNSEEHYLFEKELGARVVLDGFEEAGHFESLEQFEVRDSLFEMIRIGK